MTEIERQVLYNEIMDNCRRYIDDELYDDKTRQVAYRAMMLACGTVACMPTNDAVEVVRCKNCVYAIIDPYGISCTTLCMDTSDDHYCWWGERKEDAKTD